MSTGKPSSTDSASDGRQAEVLDGPRVIESSALVAAPLGGMTLAQLRADVIRCRSDRHGLDSGR